MIIEAESETPAASNAADVYLDAISGQRQVSTGKRRRNNDEDEDE
jgi:hypothetical protein